VPKIETFAFDRDGLQPLYQSVGRLRFVFFGHDESYLGFLCALLYFFGQGIVEAGLTISPSLNLRDIWRWDGEGHPIDILEEDPKYTSLLSISDLDEVAHYFKMINDEAFLTGFIAGSKVILPNQTFDPLSLPDNELYVILPCQHNGTRSLIVDDGLIAIATERYPCTSYFTIIELPDDWAHSESEEQEDEEE
ncbi:MAG: hypothetical protein ACMG6E_03160, partial [Candidatus Roizmanbacteria bacterium]